MTAVTEISRREVLRAAVAGLTLSHSQAPGSLTAKERVEVCFGRDDREGEAEFELLSLEQTGMSAVDLAGLFNRDQRIKWDNDFEHPMLDDPKECSMAVGLQFYDHDLRIRPEHFIPKGIEAQESAARYCIFARNTGPRGGRVTSFIRFSVVLDSFENVFGTVGDGEDDNKDEDDVRTVYMNISIEQMYTRTRFRGRGAGTALLERMGEMIWDELGHLAKQLAPVTSETGVEFRLQPYVYNEWNSRTGQLAHDQFMERLDDIVVSHPQMEDMEPERLCLEVLEPDFDGGY